MSNWNLQSGKATTINMLETSMNPYLVWLWKSKGMKLGGYEQPIIQWLHTRLPNNFKLLLSHSDLAHSVCYLLIDKNVQQADGVANVNSRSYVNKLAQEGFSNYFSQYANCDAPAQQLRVGAGSAAATASVAASCGIGDWEFASL